MGCTTLLAVTLLVLLPLAGVVTTAQPSSQLSPSCLFGTTNGLPTVVGLVLDKKYSCLPRFYCPDIDASNQASLPQRCPATPDCSIQRAFSKRCDVSQGLYEPEVCPPGFYCPTPKELIKCPAGSFCPPGSKAPTECPPFSSCPEGSEFRRYFGGLLFAALMDVAVVAAYVLVRYRERQRERKNLVTTEFSPMLASLSRSTSSSGMIPLMESKDEMEKKELYFTLDRSKNAALLQSYQHAFEGFSIGDMPALPSKNETVKPKLSLNFAFDNMGLKLPSGKTVLNGVTGEVHAGRLTAIMGPSGCGKTTFMSVLMGKVKRTEGTLMINGEEQEMQAFKKIVGYVPQEDVMLRELSVREIIYHAAAVLLPTSWTSEQVNMHVDAVIATLGLQAVQHSLIGDDETRGVSGGQRKRANIGIALAAAPLALFLDEPTSGLDSTAALTVANTLTNITALGMTVVAVIHQPRYEIFKRFDDVLLIAKGGQTAYIGPRDEIEDYFKSLGFIFESMQNPADVLMDIVSGQGKNNKRSMSAADLVAAWHNHVENKAAQESNPGAVPLPLSSNFRVIPKRASVRPQSSSTAVSKRKKSITKRLGQRQTASVLKQTWLCHNRSLVQQQRHAQSFALEIGVALASGLLMGVSVEDFKGELFMGLYVEPYTLLSPAPLPWLVPLIGMTTAVAVGLAGAPAGVKIFGEEKPVFWREAAAGHSRLAYFLGKTIAATYRFIITSMHFSALYYVMAAPLAPFESMYTIVLLMFYNVFGLASLVSLVTRRENAALLAVVVTLFTGVFNGFGPTLKNAQEWGVAFVWYMGYAMWSTEAMYAEETKTLREIYAVDKTQESFGYNLNRFALDLAMMALLGTLYRIVSYVLLVNMHRDKQR